jgi:predicted nuclease of predicted toxin-antitoxin system
MTIADSVKQFDGYMLDTTEFNAVAERRLPLSAIAGRRLFATHVQLDEIKNTPCDQIRAHLHAAVEEISAERLPTESAVWDVSRWDQAKWSTKDSAFDEMRTRLEALDKAGKTRKKSPMNQARDILIAETAIRNKLTLVSGDSNLRRVTIEFGGHAIDREQFMRATGQ